MTIDVDYRLTERHAAMLAASAIAPDIIAERGYRSLAPGAVVSAQELGATHGPTTLKKALHEGALIFPVRRCGTEEPTAWVLRPDLPRTNAKGKKIKYEYPSSVPNILDVLPRYRAALGDPSLPLWITEGAKKADALASAFGAEIVPCSINGVYGWRGTNGAGGKTVLPDIEEVALNGRDVVLAFDSDVRTNPQIQQALNRFARLLVARGAASVAYLALPDGSDGSKTGVDDYLAAGHTPADVRSVITLLSAMGPRTSVTLAAHPDTGIPMTLPPGYDVVAQAMVKVGPRGDAIPVYQGLIYVRSLGYDLGSLDEAVTISWAGASHGTVSMLRAEMAKAQALRDLLAARGALIHDGNAKALSGYLTEFIAANAADLPRVAVASHLGLHAGDVLVLPDRSIGGDCDVRYTAPRPMRQGSDPDAYPAALEAMLAWDDFGSVPSLILALALAGPMIARLHPRRNPAVYLAGSSGSGKTTLIQFCIGVWGDPTGTPLRIEATRTTTAGYLQTLAHLGGLPLFVDEAHTAQYPDRLEALAYNFANGQSYAKGTVNGTAAGSEMLSGTLFLAGEAVTEFQNSGSRNRVMWLDGNLHSPMGSEANGKAHAAMLEEAWERGMGLFGPKFAEVVWRDWESFAAQASALKEHPSLSAAPTPWQASLAIGMTALVTAYAMLGRDFPAAAIAAMLKQWAALLSDGAAEVDPALDAWERLVLMLVSAHDTTVTGWTIKELNYEPIAYQAVGETVWRVPTKTASVREKLGSPHAVQLYGPTWLKRGWIKPAKDGASTHVARIGEQGTARVLRIPNESLYLWSNELPICDVTP